MRKLNFASALFALILVLCCPHVAVAAGEPPDPPSSYPSVRSVLAVVCAGEGLLDSGKYSPDQQKLLFNRNYKDRTYLISGKISDVGTKAFTNNKYITVMVNTGHYFDVYPSSDFDLLDYNKGSYVSFVGKWTLFGSGIMVHHKIENAELLTKATPNGKQTKSNLSWIDKPLKNWNKPRGTIPSAPAPEFDDPAKSERCKEEFQIRPPTNKIERALTDAGWVHYSHIPLKIYPSGISVFFALTSVDSMGCREYGYQYFIFVDNEFAGTLSPIPMNSRNDSSTHEVGQKKGTNDITAKFDRYTKSDAFCCPSKTSTVTYKIERINGAPVVVPTTVSTVNALRR